ncbi:MAG: hypothetical protein AAFV80_15635, partial [Bacteroidota bacterium]
MTSKCTCWSLWGVCLLFSFSIQAQDLNGLYGLGGYMTIGGPGDQEILDLQSSDLTFSSQVMGVLLQGDSLEVNGQSLTGDAEGDNWLLLTNPLFTGLNQATELSILEGQFGDIQNTDIPANNFTIAGVIDGNVDINPSSLIDEQMICAGGTDAVVLIYNPFDDHLQLAYNMGGTLMDNSRDAGIHFYDINLQVLSVANFQNTLSFVPGLNPPTVSSEGGDDGVLTYHPLVYDLGSQTYSISPTDAPTIVHLKGSGKEEIKSMDVDTPFA